MSGKALAAGIAANPDDQEPVASAIPLIYFPNGAYARQGRSRVVTVASTSLTIFTSSAIS